MDALMLRMMLTSESESRDVFRNESQKWMAHIANAQAASSGDTSRDRALREVFTAFQDYLSFSVEWLSRGRPTLRRETVGVLCNEIDNASRPLRSAVTNLIRAEEDATRFQASQLRTRVSRLPVGLSVAAMLLLGGSVLTLALKWQGGLLQEKGALGKRDSQRQHLDRLAQLGTIAAGVVHEIRTPLTAIRVHANQLRRSAMDGHPDLMLIENEIRRLDRILEDFLQYARPSTPRRETVEVDSLLSGIQDLVRASLSERGITVLVESPQGLRVDADPSQMRQVLLNLVRNAADSLPAGGAVTLRARAGMDTRSKPAAPVVMLEVADTGAGIAPELESRLFEPFVSGKPHGTGLGLSIAARLVEAHDGHIQYQTRCDQGTVFTVVLPRGQNFPNPGTTSNA